MEINLSEPGGPYQIFVAEDNSSVYVRLLSNDAVGMDGDIPYTFYRYPGNPVKSGGGYGSGACGAGSCDIFFTDHPISITIYDENGVASKYYYLYDGLGSVTELIDASGNVVNSYRYTPFGDALVREEKMIGSCAWSALK